MVGDRCENLLSVEAMSLVRTLYARYESLFAEDVLRDFVRSFGDCEPITSAGAVLEAFRYELVGYAASGDMIGNSQ